jgi:hypothetical protein
MLGSIRQHSFYLPAATYRQVRLRAVLLRQQVKCMHEYDAAWCADLITGIYEVEPALSASARVCLAYTAVY